jgi:hypothetical protein
MTPRRVVAAGFIGMALTACGGTSASSSQPDPASMPSAPGGRSSSNSKPTSLPSDRFDATHACRSDVPVGFEFFGAAATTVAEVRNFSAGPPGESGDPVPLWPEAFPDVPSTAPAAWCTAVDDTETYAFYAVSPGQPALDLGRESGIESPPPGPPRIE